MPQSTRAARPSQPTQPTRRRERRRQRDLRRQRRALRRRPCPRPPAPPAGPVAPPAPVGAPDAVPPEGVPLSQSLRTWLAACLGARPASAWLLARLAGLLLGLVAGEDGTAAGVARAVRAARVSGAKRASVGRRVARLLDDSRLDPDTLLRAVLRPMVPVLLAEVVATHAARAQREPARHRRTPLLRLVLDETTHLAHGHILVVGLAYRGIVLPLALRVWAQNAPLPEGAYWGHVQGALQEVYDLLPPELRDHVLVLADRAYGVPRMLDLLVALGWDWALRVQGQVRVALRDGRVLPVRDLAPRPGTAWLGGFDRPGGPPAPPDGEADGPEPEGVPVAAFKAAGWRRSQVAAAWAAGEAEPWLLLTSLAPTAARLVDYATRWSIERLFLSWKSHGWDLEASGVTDPARLGRLLSGYVLATHWRLAAGVLEASLALADLEHRARRHAAAARAAAPAGAPRQLALPLGAAAPPRRSAPRPDAAKHSLFTLGTLACHDTAARFGTPAICWRFPAWDAPAWSRQAQLVYDGLTSPTP